MSLNVIDHTESNLTYVPLIQTIIATIKEVDNNLVLVNASGNPTKLDESFFNKPSKIELYEIFFGIKGINIVQALLFPSDRIIVYCNDTVCFQKLFLALKKLDTSNKNKYDISLIGREVKTLN